MSGDAAAGGAGEAQRPTLRVVRGDATAEEIAALVAVLTAVGGAGAGSSDDAAGRSAWSDPALIVRAPLTHGPSAWRASAWPR